MMTKDSEKLFLLMQEAGKLPSPNPIETRKILAELCRLDRRLHRLAVDECNRELSEAEKKEDIELTKKAEEAAKKLGMGIDWADPRGGCAFRLCAEWLKQSNSFGGEGWHL